MGEAERDKIAACKCQPGATNRSLSLPLFLSVRPSFFLSVFISSLCGPSGAVTSQ